MSVKVHTNTEMVEIRNFLYLYVASTMFTESEIEKDYHDIELFHIINSLYRAEQNSFNVRYEEQSTIIDMKIDPHERVKVLNPVEAIKRLESIAYQIDPEEYLHLAKYTVKYLIKNIAESFNINMSSPDFIELYNNSDGW